MKNKPYRSVYTQWFIEYLLVPIELNIFLSITGYPTNVNIVRRILIQKGVYTCGYKGTYQVHGLLFTYGNNTKINNYISIKIYTFTL